MTYITNGEYASNDDGYLIGYKLIRPNYLSFHASNFLYTQGKVVGHRPGEVSGRFPFTRHYTADQLHHCCTQNELEQNWSSYIYERNEGARLVRLLIHPDDLIKHGVTYRAYVDMISPVMFQWGVFSLDGSIAPELPPVTELAKKKLNAGLTADEVISVVMTPAPELVEAQKSVPSVLHPYYNTAHFPSNPYFVGKGE